jgi:hypothetical protein
MKLIKLMIVKFRAFKVSSIVLCFGKVEKV